MPAFFILSEYTLKTKRNIFDFFKSKFKLMTAYYAFSAIGVFIPVILGEVSLRITVDNIKRNWIDIVFITSKSPNADLWFFPTILNGLIIAFLLEKYIHVKQYIVAISVLLLLANQVWYMSKIESVLGLREALIAQFYIIIGYELKDVIISILHKDTDLVCVILLTLWIYTTAEWIHFGNDIISYWNSDVAPITWAILIAMISNSFFVCLASRANRNHFLFVALARLGRITMHIYGLHYIFLR